MLSILPARSHCSLFLVSLVWFFLPESVKAQNQIFGLGHPALSEKEIQRVKQEFANEFPLIISEGQLGLEFPTDLEEASAIVGHLLSNRGGSSSARSGNGFSYGSNDGSVDVQVSKNMSPNRNIGPQVEPCESVSIKAAGTEHWRTQFLKTKQRFQCTHVDFSSRVMFQLVSNKLGVQVVLFQGPTMISLKGKNYFELLSRPEFQQILTLSENWGIKFPANANASIMSELMLNVLSISDSEWKNFENDFLDLTADSFKKREAATERLKQELNQWKHLVAWGLTSPDVTLELKSRLMAAVKDNQTDDAAKQIVGLTSAKLLDHPESLVELLSHPAVDEKVRLVIVERLQRLTEKDFGTETAAWQKWVNENRNRESNLAAEVEPAEPATSDEEPQPEGVEAEIVSRVTIDLLREETSRLLVLEVNDQGKLRLDRNRWTKFFAEQNIPQLMKETQEQFQASGLPASWLNLGGGYDLATIDYPQLFFAQLEEKLIANSQNHLAMRQMQMQLQMNMHRMNHRSGLQPIQSHNREVQNGEIKFRIELHPENPPGIKAELPAAQYFKFSYLDDLQNTSLFLDEQPDGNFNLLICNIEDNEYVGIGQLDQQSWIHVCTDLGSYSASGASPRELFEVHADQWKKLLHPVLEKYGINLAESVGGELKFKNAVLKKGNRQPGFDW